MWADPKNNQENILVGTKAGLTPKDGDFVRVQGTVRGKLDGQNAFGGTVTSVSINANSVTAVNPVDVLAPTKLKVDVNKTITQNGYSITLKKVEFAESETRAYVQIKNGAQGKVNFYAYEAKAVQNGKQLDQQTNYDTNYPEIQSELLPGITSEGIITFKPLDPSVKSAQFIFDGSTKSTDSQVVKWQRDNWTGMVWVETFDADSADAGFKEGIC